MRMSTGEGQDEQLASETIAAAAEAGVTVFDTAHAYGRGESPPGQNEGLLGATHVDRLKARIKVESQPQEVPDGVPSIDEYRERLAG